MDPGTPSLTAVLGTFAVDAGFAWMTGCIAFVGWARGRPSPWAQAMRARHEWALALSGSGTALALVFDLWRRSAEAADVRLMAAGEATATMLVATHYGRAWMVSMVATIIIALTAAGAHRRATNSRRLVVAGWIAGLVVFACARSVVSHASSQGDLSFAVAIDAVHLVAVSSWAGVVWTSAGLRTSTNEDRFDAASWLRTISLVATIALTAIVLSGVANTWHATAGSLGASWGSTYGTTLAAKVVLVLVAAALGGMNRWVFLPRLQATPSALRPFVTVLRIEAVVLAGVLLLAAILGSLEPPGSM